MLKKTDQKVDHLILGSNPFIMHYNSKFTGSFYSIFDPEWPK